MQDKILAMISVLVFLLFAYPVNGQSSAFFDNVPFKLGTFPPDLIVARMTPVRSILRRNDSIPLSFDARDKWPNFIHPPEDQAMCNGSWAFSTAGVAADRVAIESNGKYTGNLSVQQLLSCAQVRGKDGCSGGHVDRAWQFTRHDRILASTFYENNHSQSAGPCRIPTSVGGSRQKNLVVYIRMQPPYKIGNREEDIMIDIMYNGPVQTMIKVNEDFYNYSSGIYRYSTNIPLEELNHSVRIIGWGEERLNNGETVKYWLCVNSWGQRWGENGYFKIERGRFEHFTLSAHLSRFEFEGIPTAKAVENLRYEFDTLLKGLFVNNEYPVKNFQVQWKEFDLVFPEGLNGAPGSVGGSKDLIAVLNKKPVKIHKGRINIKTLQNRRMENSAL